MGRGASMNDDNLININDRPEDEAREIRSKGGKARAEKARERATMRDIITNSLDAPYIHHNESGDVTDTNDRDFHTEDNETDYYHELAYQIMRHALDDPKYTALLLEIVGDMPDKDDKPDVVYGTVNIDWWHGDDEDVQRECNENFSE